jgi:hypothetical protein
MPGNSSTGIGRGNGNNVGNSDIPDVGPTGELHDIPMTIMHSLYV